MAKKKIELRVNFEATIVGDEDYIPSDEVFAEESITITMPVLDTKYTVFPKVLEGVTDRVIAELNAKLSEFLRKKAEEEKRQKEEAMQPSFWRNGSDVDTAVNELIEAARNVNFDDIEMTITKSGKA